MRSRLMISAAMLALGCAGTARSPLPAPTEPMRGSPEPEPVPVPVALPRSVTPAPAPAAASPTQAPATPFTLAFTDPSAISPGFAEVFEHDGALVLITATAPRDHVLLRDLVPSADEEPQPGLFVVPLSAMVTHRVPWTKRTITLLSGDEQCRARPTGAVAIFDGFDGFVTLGWTLEGCAATSGWAPIALLDDTPPPWGWRALKHRRKRLTPSQRPAARVAQRARRWRSLDDPIAATEHEWGSMIGVLEHHVIDQRLTVGDQSLRVVAEGWHWHPDVPEAQRRCEHYPEVAFYEVGHELDGDYQPIWTVPRECNEGLMSPGRACDRMLEGALVGPEQVHAAVLVGGGARDVYVRDPRSTFVPIAALPVPYQSGFLMEPHVPRLPIMVAPLCDRS